MNGMRPRAAVPATASAVVIYHTVPCVRPCSHVLVPLFYTPLDFGSAHVFPITRTQHQTQARAEAEGKPSVPSQSADQVDTCRHL